MRVKSKEIAQELLEIGFTVQELLEIGFTVSDR